MNACEVRGTDETIARLETLFQHAPVGFGFVDRTFRYVWVNDTLAALHALPTGAHAGRMVADLVPQHWPALEPLYRRALAGEIIANHAFEGPFGPGGVRHWLLSYYPLRRGGEIVGIGLIVNDVTDQRRVEEALRVRSDLYALLSRTSRAVVLSRTRDELFREVCALCVETGHFRFAWIGVPDEGRVKLVASAGDDGGYMRDAVITLDEHDRRSQGPTGRAARTGASTIVNDFAASRLTSPWHALAARAGFAASAAFPLREEGRVVAVLTLYAGVVGFFTGDLVTTLEEIVPNVSLALDQFARERVRLRDEADLRMRDRAIQAVSPGIVIADAQLPGGPVVYASPGFERLTGYTAAETLGRNCRFLQGSGTDPAAVAELRAAVHEARHCSVELLNYRKDGSSFWNQLALSPVWDDSGHLTQFVGVLTDVTERRQLEAQLRQALKMEAVGRLAAGVAHDFNNLLSVILSYTDILMDETPCDWTAREEITEIRQAGVRAADLTRQLLAFSRQQMLRVRVLDLGEHLRGMEKMLRRLLGEDIELSIAALGATGKVRADPSQIEQIVMNLAVNARDAMPAGGKLTIETADVDTEASRAASRHGVTPGPYVALTITDTGVGMDAATRERVFEPFFTTKETGRGTGLGLSTVFGIVKQSHGHVWVDDEPSAGTRFTIWLPCVDAAVESFPSVPPAPETLHGTETVLLVEDDEQVRTMTRMVLRRNGYTVLDAQNGGEAFLICEQHPAEIHLLLTDVVLPRMSGKQVAERLVAMRPSLRVLFMSGYAEGSIAQHGVTGAGVAFVEKPLTLDALLRKVREVLGDPRSR